MEYLSVFSPNAGKYGPEKTPYLDTFQAVTMSHSEMNCSEMTALHYQRHLKL